MGFEAGQLFVAGLVYLLALFAIAYATERGWVPARVARHPATYALSLGVYATTWSFYGSVGFAESQGFNFLSIYLGVTLAFLLVPVLLVPLLRLTRDYQLTSLADLFAFRYRSQAAGVLVTGFMLLGTLPYLALQILAVTRSAEILTHEYTPRVLAFGFCVTITLFAILFGARHSSPRDKHEGLVVAIAFESVVKLLALLTVGAFALFGVFGGPHGLDDWVARHPEALEALYQPVREGPWMTLMFLSFCAAFLLPRQFHMMFTENMSERTLYTAAWAFPLFLLLLNLFIPVILWSGVEIEPATSADFYVLGVPFAAGSRSVTALAFIGGLSAASAMIIVTTLALSSMCLNHLVLPAMRFDVSVSLYQWLLWARRTLIVLVVLAGYGFYLVLERHQGLVQLGLVSFVAAAQLLPGLLGLLYWPRATRAGFVAGLLGGGAVWSAVLLLPLLEASGILPPSLAFAALPPPAGADKWSYSTLATLAVNAMLFFGVSLLTRPTPSEREAADACRQTSFFLPIGVVVDATSPEEFETRLARVLGPEAARSEVGQALGDLGMSPAERDPGELRRLRERIERNLSGLVGPMLSQMIVNDQLEMDRGTRSALVDNVRFIEERLEHSQTRLEGVAAELDRLRRYHEQVLHDLPFGVCALGSDGTVVSWNLAMEQLSGLSRLAARGRRVPTLPAPWGNLIARLLASAAPHLHKVQARVDGRIRWLNLRRAVIDDPAAPRTESGVIVLVEDLTDVQALESEVAHHERLASIGRLAAGVAHEIGNPVTGIACLAQNLASETDDGEIRESTVQIIDQTRRISEILQTLVGFSHGGAVRSDRLEWVELRPCVDEALRLVRLSHAARAVECRNECPPGLGIEGDRTQLQQVFVNLLSNACDASSSAGVVQVLGRIDGESTLVEVVDQGEGIDEAVVDKIFEPFVTTKPPGRGTGLGLSVVYRIVEDHCGQIRMHSVRGCGTRVVLRFPAAREKPAPAGSAAEAERS